MADYDRRPRGGRGSFQTGRKRRYRGWKTKTLPPGALLILLDDDDNDRRQQRRRYEEPLAVTLRKQILSIAESVISIKRPTILSRLTRAAACSQGRRRC